jgi:addiction module HigA family antidote
VNETTNKLIPIHPGEILREEYMKPLGFTGDILAAALKVSRGAVHKILLGRKGITMDMAFRLARYFNTTPELWTGLQAEYDLRLARMKGQVGWRRKFKEVNWQRGAVWIGVALLILNGLFPPFEATYNGHFVEYCGYGLLFISHHAAEPYWSVSLATSLFFVQFFTIIGATAGAFFLFGMRDKRATGDAHEMRDKPAEP